MTMLNVTIHHHQKGSILIISLLFLIILTIISITSISTSVMEQKSLTNSFNIQRAFEASEFGLRSAEDYIKAMTVKPVAQKACTPTCDVIWEKDRVGQLYGGSYPNQWWAVANKVTDNAWWKATAHTQPTLLDPNGAAVKDNLSYVVTQPRFVIEEIAFIPDDLNPNTRAKGVGLTYYRITSRGTGAESSQNGIDPNQSYVQSVFGKRFN